MMPHVTILADLRQQDSGTPKGADGALVLPGARAPGGLHVLAISEAGHAARPCGALFIAHGDITNRELIEAAALSGKPLLLDTTGASLKEVVRASGWHQLAFRAGAPLPGARLVLMHGAVGQAPLNLRALEAMREHTFAATGLIDSSDGTAGALAVALGASMLLHAGNMGEYAARMRQAEALLGKARKEPDGAEVAPVAAARKHVVAARSIAAGAVIARGDLAFASPAPAQGQFAPHHVEQIIGRQAARAISAGQVILGADLSGEAPGEAQWFAPRPPREKP